MVGLNSMVKIVMKRFFFFKCWEEMEERLTSPPPGEDSEKEKNFQQGTKATQYQLLIIFKVCTADHALCCGTVIVHVHVYSLFQGSYQSWKTWKGYTGGYKLEAKKRMLSQARKVMEFYNIISRPGKSLKVTENYISENTKQEVTWLNDRLYIILKTTAIS